MDVLVNNVGWTHDRLFVEKTREEWEKEIQINLWGMINCTRAVLDGMIARQAGAIVSLGSDAGRMGEFREGVYGACKAGVIALSKSLAREVGRHGIRLNVVCPGMTMPDSDEEIGGLSMWAAESQSRLGHPRDAGPDRQGLSAAPHRPPRGRRRRRRLPRLRRGQLHHRPDAERERRLHDDVNDPAAGGQPRWSSPLSAATMNGGIARIVLYRPEQLNAINPALLHDLERVCDDHRTRRRRPRRHAHGRRARLLRGRRSANGPRALAGCRKVGRLHAALASCLQPHRGAAGAGHRRRPRPRARGGLELVLLADLVVADEEARLGDQHANFGLVAGGGGSQRLPRLIGARRAKELMLLGGWLSAEQALAWGLVNRVAPAGTLETAVAELALALAQKSGGASRTVKVLVNRGLDLDLGRGLELELELVADPHAIRRRRRGPARVRREALARLPRA